MTLLFWTIIQCQDELQAIDSTTSIDPLLHWRHTDYTAIVTARQTQPANEVVYVIEEDRATGENYIVYSQAGIFSLQKALFIFTVDIKFAIY